MMRATEAPAPSQDASPPKDECFRSTRWGSVLTSALATCIFVIDTMSTLEFAVAVLYVVVVATAASYGSRRAVLLTTLACYSLTIVSFMIAHGSHPDATASLRLLVSLASIGLTSSLVILNYSTRIDLRVSERHRLNLSRFISPKMTNHFEDIEGPFTVARYQPAVIMFVDIVDFTGYSSSHSPEAIIGMLRELLALLSKAVFAFDGTIDKFLGDGLLAVFGTPTRTNFDASKAAACALHISQTVKQWNYERRQDGKRAICVAIGIHSGDVVFGDIGSDARLEVTVLGDTVNIASRVEAQCRPLNAEILVTAAFMDSLKVEGGLDLANIFEDKGWHILRGRSEANHLYGITRDPRAC